MSFAPLSPIDSREPMFQTGTPEPFFKMKALAPRRMSTATDMYETEFEDDDGSDIEYSPRISLNSAGRRSETTLSSFEELPTPKSNNLHNFEFDLEPKAVEGPKGPHLFRFSSSSVSAHDDEYHLTMSPITPRFTVPKRPETAIRIPQIPQSTPFVHRPISTLTEAVTRLDTKEIALWSPRQVARWMIHAGFEPAIVEKFEENDISGAILVTLKFEDLRELDIQSFGQRHKLWNQIHNLRDDQAAVPPSPTEIECESEDDHYRKPKHGRRKHKKPAGLEDIISPLESVSIVGIEQLMPKPHKCAKGEACSRWKKQQRLIELFKSGHPISPKGGMFMIAGDPGNPETAPAVRPFSEALRPFSDAQPSVVASSDVLGPGTLPPLRTLEAASLASLQSRDPQENVKQFLNFQHMPQRGWSSEEPATPPSETFSVHQLPPGLQPHQNFHALPKLTIPTRPPPRSASAVSFAPHHMDRAEALSPELRNKSRSPPNIYRFGTPASDVDIPVTQVNLGPISRDASQSVPPNMSYRHSRAPEGPPIPRTLSRSSRRPSYAAPLPRLDENAAATSQEPISEPVQGPEDTANHSGWMKKRKTRMLRHEWHEHHFTLKGTHLAMHKDARAQETLESIDVDDYAIACSSIATGGKLNAAFKAMNIKLGKEKADDSAFSFQLIPAAIEKGNRIRKRESMMSGANAARDKTHHFAVKTRDERIDWMRELMLAKALKQKNEGYEINVNGNMV